MKKREETYWYIYDLYTMIINRNSKIGDSKRAKSEAMFAIEEITGLSKERVKKIIYKTQIMIRANQSHSSHANILPRIDYIIKTLTEIYKNETENIKNLKI